MKITPLLFAANLVLALSAVAKRDAVAAAIYSLGAAASAASVWLGAKPLRPSGSIDSAIPPRTRIGRLLARLFAFETMSGAGACPVYLERWTLALGFGCGVYLHHFIGDDWALDPHDHPRRFISIGLRGWYWEDVYRADGTLASTTRYSAPWVRSFLAEHLHRVRAAECGDVWTLVIVLRKSRPWGFVRDGLWMPFRDYVFGGHARHDC